LQINEDKNLIKI